MGHQTHNQEQQEVTHKVDEVDHHAKNREYYEATKIEPDISKGYKYSGCTPGELRELKYAPWLADRLIHKTHLVSIEQATVELEESLTKPPSDCAKVAIKNLKLAWAEKGNSQPWSPDVTIKSFHDVDRAYFDSYLVRRVRVRWWIGSPPALWEIMKGTLGCVCEERGAPVPTVRILLNAEAIFLDYCFDDSRESERYTLSTLLHEMIHGLFDSGFQLWQ